MGKIVISNTLDKKYNSHYENNQKELENDNKRNKQRKIENSIGAYGSSLINLSQIIGTPKGNSLSIFDAWNLLMKKKNPSSI